jgi:hypothetical protein
VRTGAYRETTPDASADPDIGVDCATIRQNPISAERGNARDTGGVIDRTASNHPA